MISEMEESGREEVGLYRGHAQFYSLWNLHLSHVVIPQVRIIMRLLSCMYIPIDLHYYLLGMPLLIAKQSSISNKYFRDARRVFIHGCVYSRSSLSEACKVEKLVLRFGTEIWY